MFSVNGRVLAVLPDNIDTDIIYPGRYLNVTDREKTPEHLFELAYPGIRAKFQPGDILVAGKNFGCGSSREQAAAAIKFAGAGAVIAASFARIFYRNAINLGLRLIIAPKAIVGLHDGDELQIDMEAGRVFNKTRDEEYPAAKLDPRAIELLESGGLIPFLKKQYAEATHV